MWIEMVILLVDAEGNGKTIAHQMVLGNIQMVD